MNTQPQSIRVPPAAPPPTRNAGGLFEPGEPRREVTFWRDVVRELKQVRWLGAREVAAQTAGALVLLGALSLFAALCGVAAQAIVPG